ncbi:non-ribosomal peptide synthetase [Actinosynnema sp. CA-299493]
MTPNPEQDEYPLTSLQHGMLLHALNAPGEGVYTQQKVLTLRHPVDAAALERAVCRLVARHPVLRTTFHLDDPRAPKQVVHAGLRPRFTREDWSDLSTPVADRRWERFLAADTAQPFDVAAEPPSRFVLARLPDRHELLWTSHHALFDGRSYVILLGELFDLYEEETGGPTAELPDRVPFGNYARWAADLDHSASDLFWRERLAGVTGAGPLLVQGEHALADGVPAFGKVWAELSEAAVEPISALAARNGVTANTVVQAAWALLLHAHSGDRHVLFGVTAYCRSFHPDGWNAVGLVMNTLPLGVRLTPGMTVPDLLRALRSAHRSLRGAEHTPLARVHESSPLPAGTPLFSSVLVFENHPIASDLRALGGAWRDRDYRLEDRTNYPLTLCVDHDGRMVFKLGHDRRRFTDDAARRLLDDLLALLGDLVAAPDDGAVDALAVPAGAAALRPGLAEVDRRRVLVDWNDTAHDYPRDRCAVDLVFDQVRLRPDATAVVAGERVLTYRALGDRVDRLAAELVARGIGPGSPVAVCLDRSPDLVVALLAVQKSGAAYVPLDPTHPPSRLAHVLADCAVGLVVTESGVRAAVPDGVADVLLLDRVDLGHHRIGAPGRADPEGIAYVIHTSGSTGRPKGVRVGHRALTNFLCSMAREPGCGPDDRLLAVTTPCFDIAALELYLPLITGGQVELAPAEATADGVALRDLLDRGRHTLVQATPATWRLLVAAGWSGHPGLRALCGGEAMPPSLADRLLDRADEVWNLYGPTETTVWSTVDRVRRGEPITIGRPVANTRCHVLDRWGRPVPPGTPGELHIGGDGVAHDYLGLPDLTAWRFVPDPFGAPGDRLYRTGDLARHLPDGRLEHLGRLDDQVKVDGHRIEPGEIEEALRRDESVREAVVAVREDASGHRALVAYVVPRSPADGVDADRLRTALRAVLPRYMVPAVITAVERVPLNTNGKVDRGALPAPVDAGAGRGGRPSTSVEGKVLATWRRVLGTDGIGVEDNFFDVGGNSLLLLHVLRELRAELSPALSTTDLLRFTTARALAAHLAAVPDRPSEVPHRRAGALTARRTRATTTQ